MAFGKLLPFIILCAAGGIAIAQQPVAPLANSWVEGGAVMVLGYVAFHLLQFTLPAHTKELAEQRAEFRDTLNAMSERYERRETLRDEDSMALSESLAALARTCARVHSLQEEDADS